MTDEIKTEVWFRNPELYIKELVEVRVHNYIFDYGYCIKKRIDPTKWADLYIPMDREFSLLVVDNTRGTLELRRGDTLESPFAIHETWEYGQPWALLESMVENPDSPDARIVITDLPMMSTQMGRGFMRQLNDLQSENPKVKIHVHGLYAWKILFGLPFGAVDIEVRTPAKQGRVILPNGKAIDFEDAQKYSYWVNLIGHSVTDLSVPRNRCMFNIESARWAAKYYRTNIKMQSKGLVVVDPDMASDQPPTVLAIRHSDKVAEPGDKFLCDTCSLQNSCKYYRSGAVCSVPDSEPSPLSRFFKTRDADTIIEGLGSVLALQATRLNDGRMGEIQFGEINPDVTAIVNSIMTNGIKLAKLVDPRLAAAGAPKNYTQFNIGTGGAPNAQGVMAGIVAELEAQGYKREDITPELIESILENSNGDAKRRAIEVAATSRDNAS